MIFNDSAIDFGNPPEPFTGTIKVRRQNNTLTVFVNDVNTTYTIVDAGWLGDAGTTDGFFRSLDRPNIIIGNTNSSGTISIAPI